MTFLICIKILRSLSSARRPLFIKGSGVYHAHSPLEGLEGHIHLFLRVPNFIVANTEVVSVGFDCQTNIYAML